jgi:RNA polymerase sigma-70 factor (ECF subfamily)
VSSTGDHDWLAERFEVSRPHMRAVALRMLGSRTEADDALQEAWIKVSRAETDGVENIAGWFTTVVARVALDMLRSRRARREEPFEVATIGQGMPAETDPEAEAVLADSLGQALLIVLDTLAPHERLAFVLHDMFDVPFEEIAPIVGRSPTAARQLASRARRRVRGATGGDDVGRRMEIVGAFLAAARAGDFEGLLRLLAPDATIRADSAAVALGSPPLTRGGAAVAKTFSGRALAAEVALIDGLPGLIWAPGGRTRVVWQFEISGGRVAHIVSITDRERISQLAFDASPPLGHRAGDRHAAEGAIASAT